MPSSTPFMTASAARPAPVADSEEPGARLVPAIVWLTIVLVLNLAYQLRWSGTEATALVLATAGLVHSVVGFLRHGRARITPPGVFLFGMGLFAYFPTFYYALVADAVVRPVEILGLTVLLLSQIVLSAVWTRSTPDSAPVADPLSAATLTFGLILGATTLCAGAAVVLLGVEPLRPLARPAAYAGVLLVALSLVQGRRRVHPLVLAALAAVFVVFTQVMFTGNGRLVLASLAVALAMVVGLRWRPWWTKPLAVLATPPGVLLLARDRADRVANPLTGYRESGLESVVWPQRRFFDLLASLQDDRSFSLGGGDTFVAALVSWVPRELWAEKPVGFGTTLTELYRPDLLSVGHSEAALLHGEFVYNFGLPGIVLLVLGAGWTVMRLDQAVRWVHDRPVRTASQLTVQAIVIAGSASLLDLVWVGTYTYVERAGFTCAVLGLALLVTVIFLRRRPESHGPRGRPTRRPHPELVRGRMVPLVPTARHGGPRT